MKLLISKETLNTYKSRDKLPLECEQCHQTFYRPKNDIQWAYKRKSTNSLRFCNRKCRGEWMRTKKVLNCKYCNTPILRFPGDIKRTQFSFCSSSCSAKYWNVNKTWGTNRSKLEKWMEQRLIEKYPDLKILYNDRTSINAELDIYIPSLVIAFELNGIFHYEPIYGKEQMNKTITNDNRKFQACLEQGIELCIIDTYNAKYLKKERDQKFLNIITNLIDIKLADKSHNYTNNCAHE